VVTVGRDQISRRGTTGTGLFRSRPFPQPAFSAAG
jgi:hypothetical protein